MVHKEVGEDSSCTLFFAAARDKPSAQGGAPAFPREPVIDRVAGRGGWNDRPEAAQDRLPGLDRRQAEALAQRWESETPGRGRELFCTPILIAFSETIGESQLDQVLRMANRNLGIRAQMQNRLRDSGLTPLVVLDDVFPMCELKRATLDQVSRAVRTRSVREFRNATSSWSRNLTTPMRRSAAFLFYLVGVRADADVDSSYRDGATFDALSTCIARYLGERMGIAATVQVNLFRGFFDGLFEGVWMYQEARLSQVAALAMQSHADTRAQIVTEVSRETHTIVVRLGANDATDSIGRSFRLTGRPGDDASLSVARIRSALEAAGLNRIEAECLVSRQDHFAMWISRRRIADRLSVPL